MRSYSHEVAKLPPLPSSFLTELTTEGSKDSNVLLTIEQSGCGHSAISKDNPPPCGPVVHTKPASTMPLELDHSYFKVPVKTPQPNTQVTFMKYGTSIPVGTGTVLDGRIVHGKPIPDGFVRVMITSIEPNTVPMFASHFDNKATLEVGQFTAWQVSCLKF